MAKPSYKDKCAGEGMVEIVVCPMCGWRRPVKYGVSQKTGEPRQVRFDKVDIENNPMMVCQRLHGAGRGSPDAKIETVWAKMLTEMPEEYRKQIALQAEWILEVLGERPASSTPES